MALSWTFLQSGLAILLLSAGVVNDLRARKVQNQIVIGGLILGLIFILATQGSSGLLISVISFATAFVSILPLFITRVLGGGDVKLFLAVSIFLGWHQVLVTLFASLIWGSLLGIFQIFLKGEGKVFVQNLLKIAQRKKLQEQNVHKIPFTVALLFGFLSCLVWEAYL